MLESGGHEVMWAGDGAAGYWRYLLFRPDLVLTDIDMPVKNGLQMTSDLRMLNPGVRVIYMSVDLDRFRSQLDEEKRKYRAGLLKKPFSWMELMRSISGHSGRPGKEEGGR